MIRNLTFILVAIFQMTLLHGQIVKNGIADLTNHDFNTSPSIELNGTWNFYQSSFITTLNESILETPSSIKVPLRWDQSDYPAKGFGTYELTIIKNANAPLAIRVPYIFSSYNFFINGILMTKMGTPGINENTSIPGWQVKLVPTSHFKSDTLQLLIQVSNFDYSKGGIGKPLVIGTHEYLFEQKFIKDVYDVFFTGCLVMGGFFFLGLYFYGRRKKMTGV